MERRNGTNFENLNEYLVTFDEQRKGVEVESQNTVTWNGLEFVSRLEKFEGGIVKLKTYSVLIDNQAYSLSTTSPELYDDLDKIAKSFRYIP